MSSAASMEPIKIEDAEPAAKAAKGLQPEAIRDAMQMELTEWSNKWQIIDAGTPMLDITQDQPSQEGQGSGGMKDAQKQGGEKRKRGGG